MKRKSGKTRALLGLLSWISAFSLLQTSQAHDPGDPWTAHYMWRRYHNTTPNCPGDPNAPEYECTGILIRATSPQKEPQGGWVPEKKSYGLPGPHSSAGGVSFSYIRADSKFGKLAFSYENGFTLLPHAGKYTYPKNGTKMGMNVLCAFPLDAATDDRSWGGCGAPNQQPYRGLPCQQMNIGTVDDWMARYRPGDSFAYHDQCGFDMKDGARRPSDFTTVLRAKQATDARYGTFTEVNELRLATWGSSPYDSLNNKVIQPPIESFFYIVGTGEGLANARYDQKKYFDIFQIFIPIIAITMPQSAHQDYDFHYNSADQAPGVVIPTFPYPDPLPCTPGNFDTQC